MLRSAALSCRDDVPCRGTNYPCAKCEAALYLTEEDWYVIRFYQTVYDQVDGTSGLPRLVDYEAAARRQGYPEHVVPWLVAATAVLARLAGKQDEVDWIRECGKPYRLIGPEDVGYGGN